MLSVEDAQKCNMCENAVLSVRSIGTDVCDESRTSVHTFSFCTTKVLPSKAGSIKEFQAIAMSTLQAERVLSLVFAPICPVVSPSLLRFMAKT